ncbi:MAG TPA: LPS export ABC transporter permease LptF [Steroidobacteraceae bacterium]|nr:LPS export ABC transporter permease LptF [Steroidobacteraceae bacterium]
MIINRYLLHEIIKPLVVSLAVLAILFTSFGAAEFLSNAMNGLLPTDMIVQLIGLRTLIALELLVPISLYLAVIMALGRMYSDSELTAIFALGFSPAKVMGVVLALSLCMALIVAGLSLIARPWAYQRSHELSNLAAASLNTNAMEAGTFYAGSHGNRTIFIDRRAGPAAPGHDVFVQLKLRGTTRIIHARSVEHKPDNAPHGDSEIHLTDAHVYDIVRESDSSDVVMNVKDLVVQLTSPEVEPPGYSSVAASNAYLASSASAPDIAEIQWRLSTFWSTLLLGMLGVPLSRSRPRQHRYAKIGIAILIYAGYYLLYESARTWVQNGLIRPFPGIWWVPALLALVLIVAWLGPGFGLTWRRIRAC